MAKDDLAQRDGAAVVAIRARRAHAPQRPCEKCLLRGPVPVALVEARSQVVPFEVREDVPYQEGMPGGDLQRRIPAAVIDRVEERRGRGEQVVEDASRRILDGLDIGHPAVVLDGEGGYMARGAAEPVGDVRSPLRWCELLVAPPPGR